MVQPLISWMKKQQENYFGRDKIQVPFIVYWKDLPVQEVSKLTSHTDLLPALMSSIFKVKNPSFRLCTRSQFI